jgi:hypothetical protein
MKVRIFGFCFDAATVPPALSRATAFDQMVAHPGTRHNVTTHYGATRITKPLASGHGQQEWIAGLVLRVRDSQAFMKFIDNGGQQVLTAEELGEGEKLAEASFFVAHPDTGSGLITHHYHATSIMSFGILCSRIFNAHRKAAYAAAIAAAGSTAERRNVKQQFRGALRLNQLSQESNLKELVKRLERVNSAEFAFTSVRTRETLFRGIASKAEKERIRFQFPPDTDPDEIAEALDPVLGADDLDEVKVSGKDSQGQKKDYWLEQNPLVFGEYDYDDAMRHLRLDLSDWPASIAGAGPIDTLARIAGSRTVLHQLTHS